MNITPITAAEFNSVAVVTRQPSSTLGWALFDVQPGEGFKLPCTYKHRTNQRRDFVSSGKYFSSCNGMAQAHNYANRHGFKITCKCKNGILYVMRKVAA